MPRGWIKIRNGLLDPKHYSKMGDAVWLYLFLQKYADWDTGKVWEYQDRWAAEELGMSVPAVRRRRRKLQDEGYIRCEKNQYSQMIEITNYESPAQSNAKRKSHGNGRVPGESHSEGPDSRQSDGRVTAESRSASPSLKEPDKTTDNTQQKDSSGGSRRRTKRDDLKLELEKHFSQVTGNPVPNRATKKQQRAAAVRWWNPLIEIAGWFDDSLGPTKEHISATVKAMRSEGLSTPAPQSIVEVARDLYGRNKMGGSGTVETDEQWRKRVFGD